MRYQDFELRLRSDPQGDLWADLVRSPFGTAEARFEPPLAGEALEERLRAFESLARGLPPRAAAAAPRPPAPVSLSELGRTLFAALFRGAIAERFRQSLAQVALAAGAEGLRLLLRCDPDDPPVAPVAALPWELLAETGDGDFLAQARSTPLVRYFPLAGPPIRPRSGPLQILVVRAAPVDQPALDLEAELARIWASFARRPEVRIGVLDHPSLAELRHRLRGEPWQVLHFMGHGRFDAATGQGLLAFERPGGKTEAVPAALLATHLKDTRDLRLVVLNSCATGAVPYRDGHTPYTALAPALLRAGVPAVLAMRFPVSNPAATAFSAELYAGLAAGDGVDAAMVEGRLALLREEATAREWATPILFSRVPDGDILGELRPSGEPLPAPPQGVTAAPSPWQEEPLRLAVFTFKDTGAALLHGGEELEREGVRVLDLRDAFGGPDGRYPNDPTVWQSRIFPALRAFLAQAARERRPLHLSFAAHASVAFAAGYCLEAKSGLDVTLRQRGANAGDWHAETGVVPDGRLFRDEPDRPRDPAAVDVVLAVGITRPVVEDVELYLEREKLAVRRVLPVTLAAGPGQAGVRDGTHALALAADLAEKVRRRTVHEHEGVLHLFVSAPNALLFYLGQLARDFGRLQLYEFGFGSGQRGHYRPSIALPARGKEA